MTQSGFGDSKLYREQKAIVERFNAVVPMLKKLHQNGHYKEAIQKFRDALKDTTHDLGKLPVFRDSGMSLTPDKEQCVVYLVAKFVVDFWKYTQKHCPVKTVIARLIFIETLANIGLDRYEVAGEKYDGYYLERKI